MMNCLTTRAALLADPTAHTAAMSQHLAQCVSCRTFAATVSLDAKSLRAAIDVPVPQHLEERILLHSQLKRNSRDRFGWLRQWPALLATPQRAYFAAACSLTLAIGLWFAQPSPNPALNWSEVALAHVIGEPGASLNKVSLPRAALNNALASYGLTLNGDLGHIRYVDHCALPGGRGVHVVIETPDLGKVTLILPPVGMRVAASAARGEGHAAQMENIHGASVGIVTNEPERLKALTARLHGMLVTKA